VVTPFTLAGAMAPVTMAGAVAQSLAEGLCAVVLAQIDPARRAACAIGTFTSNVDMKSGAPAFGTPEYMRATQMTGQLARFYKPADAGLGRVCGQRARRAGGVGNLEQPVVGGAGGGATWCITRRAGWRAG
jgi:trimethylamine--corrinoid protein Co-methyltransferase